MSATERLKTPMHFPCAARVKMPQLGSEDSDLKDGLKSSRYAPDTIVFRHAGQPNEPISRDYLKKVSTGLSFEEEVVKERCFHALPYDEKYMVEVFDVGDLVSLPARTKIPVGRHNARGVDIRHMPCNLTKTSNSQLKPLKRRITERAREMHLEAIKREENKENIKKAIRDRALEKLEEDLEAEEREEAGSRQGVFLTETKTSASKVKAQVDSKDKTEQKEKREPTKSAEKSIPSHVGKRESVVTLEELQIPEKRGNDWDAYLMSMLSTNTANWIVYERTPVGSQDREKLQGLLKKWHGEPEHTDLVREDMSDNEVEEEEEDKKPKKKWKKKEATLLEKVYNLEDVEPQALDPYSDDNKAPFYRQPAGLRRARKHEEKEELGAINTTAANITVSTFKPPPPPTLRDFINPEVGSTLIETSNMFQQEQLTGTEQVYEAFADKTKIMMESHNKYKKDLQPTFPQSPKDWFPETDAEKQVQAKEKKKQKKYERGHKRWKTLPQPIDGDSEALPYGYDAELHREASPNTMKQSKRNTALTRANSEALPYGYDAELHREPSPKTMKQSKRNKTLTRATDEAKTLNFSDRKSPVRKYNPEALLKKLQQKKQAEMMHDPKFIIDEWRTKWHLSGQYVDSTPEDLITDMADIQSHVRLKAIATCAKASDYKPPTDHAIQLVYGGVDNHSEGLPEKLYVALECLLEDPVDKVRKAAAITLYSLNRPSPRAEEILYEALQNENPVDRWAAAQCLAHFGLCDSDVVGEILQQVMTTEDTIKHERGISMLGILSISSNLVHSMTAEQLNSSSWRHKIIACKVLPTLRGDINKDITNKLSDLMWNDWHSEVRRAAAQCLGKTGHGRDVHDDLRQRIMEGDERLKLEALSKVGQLGIMTAKLLPAFLKCFEDEYVSVRSEVCISCGNLAIKDEEVIAKLIHLATFDGIWKVKALSFQEISSFYDCVLKSRALALPSLSIVHDALGKIGVITEQILDCLLWAVRYEENPGVRAEACHTLKVLNAKTEEVADVLQERCLVENNQLVRDEIASTLKMFDISATEDMDMVAQMKKHVKKLCQRNVIATQITMNEKEADRQENMSRMIYESEKEMKPKRRRKKKVHSPFPIKPVLVSQHHLHLTTSFYKISEQRKELVSKFELYHIKAGETVRKAQEKPVEPVLDRMRSLSRASSKTKVESGRSSPVEPPREGVFTPTADQELEDILNQPETVSGKTSPTGTTPGDKSRATTPGDKSRATTATTTATSEGDSDEEEEEGNMDESDEHSSEEGEGTPSTPGSGTPGAETPGKGTPGTGTPGKSSDGEEGELVKIERPTSTVKFASHLEVADIPSRSRSSLGPSRLSLMDDQGKPSRLSMNTGTTGTDGMIFGRDAVAEREKINTEARNTFAAMDLRYQDMVQDLIDLDNTFELGLMSGSRQDFEERISSVKVVRTPPASGKPMIELSVEKQEQAADDIIDVVDDNEDGDDLDTQNTDKGILTDSQTAQFKSVTESQSKGQEIKGLVKGDGAVISDTMQDKQKSEVEIVVTRSESVAKDIV